MNQDEPFDLNEKTGLGLSEGEMPLRTREEVTWIASQLAARGRRSLDILSQDLDPLIYDRPEFVEALRGLSLESRFSRIRLLLRDPDRLQKEGHHLLSLYRRLPSRVFMRQAHPDYAENTDEFMIVDGTAYLYRQSHERFDATADFNDKRKAELYRRQFEEIWEKSEADYQLRELKI